MSVTWETVLGLGGLIVTFLGSYLVFRAAQAGRRSASIQTTVDQLQEEVSRTTSRLDVVTARNRLLENYVAALRDHIYEGRRPPPPPFPPELTNH